MFRICLFAGTTEGRRLVEFLRKTQLSVYVSVATEYGETLVPKGENIEVHAGRLNQAEMETLFAGARFSLVVDATHPFAKEVTQNIAAAARATGTEMVRLVREAEDMAQDATYVASILEAAECLKGTAGNILLTTGSKELMPFTGIPNYQERVYARVLPMKSSLDACAAAGIPPAHIIAMQGPFTEEMNRAILRMAEAKYLVTKDAGPSGGFAEKLEAARKERVKLIIIGRPQEQGGIGFAALMQLLQARFGVAVQQRVSVIGIGMGAPNQLTGAAQQALAEAECVIGAKRMVDAFAGNRPSFASMENAKIAAFIRAHPEYQNIAVLMSGDVGFYSGAKKLLPMLSEFAPCVYPGISSLQYFCAKLQTAWDDAFVLSLHGRDGSAVPAVLEHRKVFALVGGAGGARRVCEELMRAGLGQVAVAVGEQLSYPDERITEGTAETLSAQAFSPLCVLLIQNKNARPRRRCACLPDEAFLRRTGVDGNVPMTKAEVRAVSIAKLGLEADSIVYDIGAGTGSVSVEMAGICTQGHVYAIECKAEAAALVERNKQRFGLANLTVIKGAAPEACAPLPPPTHAFIGGTSGNLSEVLELLLAKNPSVRIVMNLIALESIAEAVRCVEAFGFEHVEMVQVSIAKAKKLGRYHLMNGQNPILVLTCEKHTANRE